MSSWLPWLIALVALIALAPLVAWAGRRVGSRARGGLMMAGLLLGLGQVLDPPSKHATESTDPAKGPADRGEPPLED